MKRAMCIPFAMILVLLATSCSVKPSKEELLRSMVDRVSEVESYQLEAEVDVDGERFLMRQWFLSPDSLRTVVTGRSELEQILVLNQGKAHAYYSATRQWVALSEPDTGPFPWGMPLLFLLSEVAKGDVTITETFSSVKVSARGVEGWDRCEIVISLRSRLPEACVLTRGQHMVKVQILSFVSDFSLSQELFLPGR